MPVQRKAQLSIHSESTNGHKQENKLAAFEFHGLAFSPSGETHSVSDCPFCGKERKFFVKNDTGQWDCKVCGDSGNIYTFLRQLAKQKAEFFNSHKGAKVLGELRNLPSDAFFGWDIGCEDDFSRFYIPVYSWTKPNTLTGLRVWDGPDTKGVLSTAGTKNSLLLARNIHTFPHAKQVYLCEGEWDAYALEWLRAKLDLEFVVLGVPGAGTSLKPYLEYFHGKEVFFLYDADDPGFSGQEKASLAVSKVTSSVKCILWNDVPEGYDLRDFISERIKKPKAAWKELQALLRPRSEVHSSPENENPDTQAPIEHKSYKKVPTFKALLKEFGDYIYLDPDIKDAIAIVMASVLSIRITPDTPIWMFLVGTSGSGKSLILDSLSGSDYCRYESTLRPAALVSGLGEDCSLIPKLKDLCLIIRDYTGIISQDRASQEQIYGILREAYDGEYKVQYGNRESRHFVENYFSTIAGVTHVIHSDQRASLGERFLKCELLGTHYDPEAHSQAAMYGQSQGKERKEALKEIVGAFLSQEIPKKPPQISKWIGDRIIALSRVIAHLRASVDYSKSTGDINYRPRPEAATRLTKQLGTLCQALAVVLGKTTIDQDCYRLAEKVAMDTSTGFHLEILKALMEAHPRPLTRNELASRCTLKERTIDQKLHSLLELHAVIRIVAPIPEDGRPHSGKPPFLYKPSPTIIDLWQRAKVTNKKSLIKS